MAEFIEEELSPFINYWSSMRKIVVNDDDLDSRLSSTVATVNKLVFTVKIGGFPNHFVKLLTNLRESTEGLYHLDKVDEYNVEKRVLETINNFGRLIRFRDHYEEDMKPFFKVIEHEKEQIISALEYLSNRNDKMKEKIERLTQQIIDLWSPPSLTYTKKNFLTYSIGAACSVVLALTIAPSVMPFVIYGVSLSIASAYNRLKNLFPRAKDSFTTKDLNLIGLRKASRKIDMLKHELRQKMYFEEDNGRNSQKFLNAIRLIEEESNEISNLILGKIDEEKYVFKVN